MLVVLRQDFVKVLFSLSFLPSFLSLHFLPVNVKVGFPLGGGLCRMDGFRGVLAEEKEEEDADPNEDEKDPPEPLKADFFLSTHSNGPLLEELWHCWSSLQGGSQRLLVRFSAEDRRTQTCSGRRTKRRRDEQTFDIQYCNT